ncbi:hypothetical protein RND81_02G221900 [Saponaria officinalis]
MVVVDGAAVKVDICSLITYRRQRKRGPQSQEFIPDEIWLEIVSRLSIKSLIVSQSVCKLWRNIFFTLHKKIDANPLCVPLCGLLLISFGRNADLRNKINCFSYFCFRNKRNFITRQDSFENNSIYSSGFERGLLNDLSFDFSAMHGVFPGTADSRFISFVMHGGLILLTLRDCTSQVYNPATNQIHFMPNSPIVEKYGFDNHTDAEKPGLIIQLPSCFIGQKCRFMVVRFCFLMRIMEVYNGVTREWRRYRLKLGREFLSSASCHLQNYVCFFENRILSLYVLTNKGCGIAIKFMRSMSPEMKRYCFPLPEVVVHEYSRARLWECEETLYLSFYSMIGLWIWKAGSTQVDSWTWVSVLEISPERQSCMPVARECLSKLVLNDIVQVIPHVFHPNFPILYLVVDSSMFAYNLKTDTLDKIGELKDLEYGDLDFVHTYKPCFSIMDTSNE